MGLSFSALIPIAGRAAPDNPASSPASGLHEVADGVWVHRGLHGIATAENYGDIANLTAIVGRDSAAAIDTGGSYLTGTAFREAIEAKTDRPVRFVINTHMHPDHVLGNAAFADLSPTYVANKKLPIALAMRAKNYMRSAKDALGDDLFAGTEIVIPKKLVDDSDVIDLGDRKLSLKARPTAHTDNDLTIHDEKTGTLIAGDLLFSEHIPTIDGSLVGWLKLIDVLKTESASRVVPGHGPASMKWPDALKPMQSYLQTIADQVRQAIADGLTLEEATKTVGKEIASHWQLADEHHIRNVTAAYAELEWE